MRYITPEYARIKAAYDAWWKRYSTNPHVSYFVAFRAGFRAAEGRTNKKEPIRGTKEGV